MILTSGYAFEHAGAQCEAVTFLRKPFLPLDLLKDTSRKRGARCSLLPAWR